MSPEGLLRQAGLPVVPAMPLSGGDMGEVWRCGDVVVKSHPSPPAGLYRAEARGLRLIAATGVRTPAARWVGEQGLILEWLAPGPADDAALGEQIARLHAPAARYGGEEEVFLGRFRLPPASGSWAEVWVEGRVLPLLEATRSQLGPLSRKVDALLASYAPPEEGPVLLHGDLWSGNVLATAEGPALIDPSAWYGERAVDLAMMDLFGGFSATCHAAYEAVRPVPREVREAIPYYQLYFLLVHVHFFGAGYLAGVERVVHRYA